MVNCKEPRGRILKSLGYREAPEKNDNKSLIKYHKRCYYHWGGEREGVREKEREGEREREGGRERERREGERKRFGCVQQTHTEAN